MTDLSGLLGQTLDRALGILKEAGLQPEVSFTQSPRHPAQGTPRVVRLEDGGQKLTAAYFPDRLKDAEAAS